MCLAQWTAAQMADESGMEVPNEKVLFAVVYSRRGLRLFRRQRLVCGMAKGYCREDGRPSVVACLDRGYVAFRVCRAVGCMARGSGCIERRILREAASPGVYRALTVLSLLPVADENMLNRLLDTPLEGADYYHLRALSFVRDTVDGITRTRSLLECYGMTLRAETPNNLNRFAIRCSSCWRNDSIGRPTHADAPERPHLGAVP